MNETISFDISIEEFEQRIQEYYLNQDSTIADIKVNYVNKVTSGQHDSFWQREVGRIDKVSAIVEITRNITVFSEKQQINKRFNLGEKELKEIFSTLLEKDNLKLELIYPAFLNPGNIRFSCSKKEKKENESNTQLQNNISPKTKILTKLSQIFSQKNN